MTGVGEKDSMDKIQTDITLVNADLTDPSADDPTPSFMGVRHHRIASASGATAAIILVTPEQYPAIHGIRCRKISIS
jgi:hypothetical protein